MSRPINTLNKITVKQLADAIAQYQKGDSLQKCVETLPITWQTLREHFKRRGVVCRKNSWAGKNNPKFNGGGEYKNKHGYIVCYDKGKKRKKHRVIIEGHIGRKLRKDEVVHHINGIKDDNRIENLEITNAKQHNRKHATERWSDDKWKSSVVDKWLKGGNAGMFKKT